MTRAYSQPRTFVLSWLTLLLAPIAWATALGILWSLTNESCVHQTRTAMWVSAGISVLVAWAPAPFAWLRRRRLDAASAAGERFRFMGRTADPHGVVRDADVVLMTSISEGLPMSVLEAMSQGRPIVATCVGGVPDVVRGCGALAAPGDDHALAMGVVMLLRNPELAWRLGRRGHDRLGRLFNEDACVEGYRSLLHGLTTRADRPRALRDA